MKIDSMIVGCGIAGSVLARRLAEEKDQQVLIIKRRPHVGGYCYDYRNEDGILVHRYGPHIFFGLIQKRFGGIYLVLQNGMTINIRS